VCDTSIPFTLSTPRFGAYGASALATDYSISLFLHAWPRMIICPPTGVLTIQYGTLQKNQ